MKYDVLISLSEKGLRHIFPKTDRAGKLCRGKGFRKILR